MIVYRSHGDDSKTIDDLIEAINSLDSTNVYEVGGFDVVVNDTGKHTLETVDDSIVLDSANKKIYIRDTTTGTGAYGEKGIQLDFNAGTPRAYIGDGANQYFQYDGTNISWKGTNTELTAAGALNVSNIVATGGRMANWYINTNTISSGAVEASSNVLIDSVNSLLRLGSTTGNYMKLDGANLEIESSNYVSGPLGAGFHIDPTLAEFGDIRARGKITTSVFERDSISAIGGQLIVANADILNADMTAADNSTLTIVGDTTFAVNDILVIGDGVDLEYMRVTNIASAPQYTVTRDLGAAYGANANPVWKKGTAVTVFGSSNGVATYSGGWLYLKGAGTNAPYYAVVTRTGIAYNAYTEYARFGNLNGFLDYATDLYGFAVGDSTDYVSFDPTNSLRIYTKSTNAITIGVGGNIALNYGGDIRFTTLDAPSACTAALLEVAGNIDAGTHDYIITFVNDYGETNQSNWSNEVTNDGTHQQNSLTNIPIASSGDVTARKIYRTKAGTGQGSVYYLLATIADNTTTTYTDNTADAGLGATAYVYGYTENTTFGKLVVNNISIIDVGGYNVSLGRYAFDSNTAGYWNTALGNYTLTDNTSGISNVAVGQLALGNNTTGSNNTAVGVFALDTLTTSGFNVGIGQGAGEFNTGANNVLIGYQVGRNGDGSSNIFIGYQAGYNEAGSNKLYIENSDSSTPLIYGEFDNNLVYIHGDLRIRNAEHLYIDSAGNDKNIDLYHDDTDGIIATSSGDLKLQPTGGEIIASNAAKFQANSAGDDKNIQLYHDDTDGHIVTSSGDLHLEPTGSDVMVTGDLHATGDISTTVWTDFAPTFAVAGGTAPTYTNTDICRYCQIGKMVYGYMFRKNSAGGSAGAGAATITFTLPVAPKNTVMVGWGFSYESGGTICPVNILCTSGSTASFYNSTNGNDIVGNDQSSTARQIHANFMYEVT